MFTDKYGRIWNYTPAHDTSEMLQVSPYMIAEAFRFQTRILNWNPNYQPALDFQPDADGYLLRSGEHWFAGIRYGNQPFEYLSPSLLPEVINLLIRGHKLRAGFREFAAISALLPTEELS